VEASAGSAKARWSRRLEVKIVCATAARLSRAIDVLARQGPESAAGSGSAMPAMETGSLGTQPGTQLEAVLGLEQLDCVPD
jgi:hypothetical protein